MTFGRGKSRNKLFMGPGNMGEGRLHFRADGEEPGHHSDS